MTLCKEEKQVAERASNPSLKCIGRVTGCSERPSVRSGAGTLDVSPRIAPRDNNHPPPLILPDSLLYATTLHLIRLVRWLPRWIWRQGVTAATRASSWRRRVAAAGKWSRPSRPPCSRRLRKKLKKLLSAQIVCPAFVRHDGLVPYAVSVVDGVASGSSFPASSFLCLSFPLRG